MLTKSHSQGTQKLITRDCGRCRGGSCSSFGICRLPNTSDIFQGRKFFRNLSDKLSKAISLKISRTTAATTTSTVPSTAAAASAGRSNSRKFAAPRADAHREEAIEDCIEFINHSSSSSLPRSQSVVHTKSTSGDYETRIPE